MTGRGHAAQVRMEYLVALGIAIERRGSGRYRRTLGAGDGIQALSTNHARPSSKSLSLRSR